MAYLVDRVVISDAYREPEQHYHLLTGGRSRLVQGRRPSVRYLVSNNDTRSGLTSIIGDEVSLFEDILASLEEPNEFVNQLRDEIRDWRNDGYRGTAMVTRRLLEWWFERDEERKATGKRFFFCQQEAIETVIYLYEVKNRYRMPETGELIRYALKLATGTGKTVVMALLITWSTLHRRKVSGSVLSNNFLIIVPNLTVRDRVRGIPRGDGLDPSGPENLYSAFDTVPPEYEDDFNPNILVRNWQAISLTSERDDWISEEVAAEGRFIPASVLQALQKRARQDPNRPIKELLGGWRDLVIINDEAHHVYGEKRTRSGEESKFIKWSKIIEHVSRAANIGLILDLSATPWYGSGSPKPEGTLFEWLVSDFSVYDAFESGLVKIVRLPDPSEGGNIYINLWEGVKGARTKEEYLVACKGAIASIYASWKKDFEEWSQTLEFARGPSPVILIVANDATRASWLFEHITKDYELLRNPEDEDPTRRVTIQIDSSVFNADRGSEAILREMVNTVGKQGRPGEFVRCIISVNMLTEGWDVKSITHILGLRAFGSPLLTEQVIGRGLRRTNYDVLNQPLEERPVGSDETVDAFGIPFIGFPVEKRKRARTGSWGQKPILIDKDISKVKYRLNIPNVRSWGVGIKQPLADLIRVNELPALVINPKDTPPQVKVRPVVGGAPESVMTLEEFRSEYPLLRSKMIFARELYEATNPGNGNGTAFNSGPTFEELFEVASLYVDSRVTALGDSKKQDIGIYYWSRKALDILETAIRQAPVGTTNVPVLGTPNYLDTEHIRPFRWTGIEATGKKSHTIKVPCHTDLERQFSNFLDSARDVLRYLKNERFGFSITYYENSRPRQYYPDFIVTVRDAAGGESSWIVETKGEVRHNTTLKQEAAQLWCEKMSSTRFGKWQYCLVPQREFERLVARGARSFSDLSTALGLYSPGRPSATGDPEEREAFSNPPPEEWEEFLVDPNESRQAGVNTEGAREGIPTRDDRNIYAGAVARILDFNGERLEIGKQYTLEVGLVSAKAGNVKTDATITEKPVSSNSAAFLITVRGDNITFDNWYRELLFHEDADGLQSVNFIFQPLQAGNTSLFVDYFYERHWLQQLTFDLTIA